MYYMCASATLCYYYHIIILYIVLYTYYIVFHPLESHIEYDPEKKIWCKSNGKIYDSQIVKLNLAVATYNNNNNIVEQQFCHAVRQLIRRSARNAIVPDRISTDYIIILVMPRTPNYILYTVVYLYTLHVQAGPVSLTRRNRMARKTPRTVTHTNLFVQTIFSGKKNEPRVIIIVVISSV